MYVRGKPIASGPAMDRHLLIALPPPPSVPLRGTRMTSRPDSLLRFVNVVYKVSRPNPLRVRIKPGLPTESVDKVVDVLGQLASNPHSDKAFFRLATL